MLSLELAGWGGCWFAEERAFSKSRASILCARVRQYVFFFSFQRQNVSCSGIRCPAPTGLEGNVQQQSTCLKHVCPEGRSRAGAAAGHRVHSGSQGEMWQRRWAVRQGWSTGSQALRARLELRQQLPGTDGQSAVDHFAGRRCPEPPLTPSVGSSFPLTLSQCLFSAPEPTHPLLCVCRVLRTAEPWYFMGCWVQWGTRRGGFGLLQLSPGVMYGLGFPITQLRSCSGTQQCSPTSWVF